MEKQKPNLRDLFQSLYGDEKKIIVLNKTTGVVSIGFGENGGEGGKMIERSDLPIVLTEEHSAEVWLKSSDFRRALAKGWLEPVSQEEADELDMAARSRRKELARLAAREKNHVQPSDVNITQLDEDGMPQMAIDENTATLIPAAESESTKKYMEYEAQFTPAPTPTQHPGVIVIGDNVSSRALALVEACNRGQVPVAEALTQLDTDSKLMTKEDLRYIVDHCNYDTVKEFANSLADKPRAGRPKKRGADAAL